MKGIVAHGNAKSVTKGEDSSFVKDNVVWRVPRAAYTADPADVCPAFPSRIGRDEAGKTPRVCGARVAHTARQRVLKRRGCVKRWWIKIAPSALRTRRAHRSVWGGASTDTHATR
jgi:hypothetical protein